MLRATTGRACRHRTQLEDIDKATKGACLWKRFEVMAMEVVGGTGIEPVAPAV